MKKITNYILIFLSCLCLFACSGEKNSNKNNSANSSSLNKNTNRQNIDKETKNDSKALIVYFSRFGNMDFPNDVDATSSASVIIKDDTSYGNTQYFADFIQQSTNGDMFAIQVKEKYSSIYDDTVNRAEKENTEKIYPELSSHIDNLDKYQTIFLGFPNWFYDMPMAVYSFLNEYDLSGKTIIPFCTNGGSDFSNAIEEIQSLESSATVVKDGLAISHSDIEDLTLEEVQNWIQNLNVGL